MYTEAIALTAAVLFGGSAVLLKKGYVQNNVPLAAVTAVLAVNVAVLWTISLLFVPLSLFLSKGVPYFIAGGVLGQGLARMLQYTGIQKVGPAHNHTVLGSVALFSALFAIALLGEQWTLSLFLGTVLVVGGVALLARKGNTRQLKRSHLLFPLAAAIVYGFVSVIQKSGLAVTPDAIVGATTATTSALLGMTVFAAARRKLPQLRPGKALPFFLAAGAANSTAFLLNFEALKNGNVTVVMPLIATQPLFAMLFSYLFLKSIEKITWNVIAGAAMVLAGIVMVTGF